MKNLVVLVAVFGLLLIIGGPAFADGPPWEMEDRVSKLEKQVAELTKKVDVLTTVKTTGDVNRNLTAAELIRLDPAYLSAPDQKVCINGNCTDGQVVRGVAGTGGCSGGCDCSKSYTGYSSAQPAYPEGGGPVYAQRRVLFPRLRGAFRGGCGSGGCGGGCGGG